SRLLEYIHAELRRVDAPVHLVQKLSPPVDRSATKELMERVDLVVVTGSQSNVSAAYSSGTPAIGVGVGNATVIVDESAGLEDAAKRIMLSKTFDHATSCSSENAVIILDEVRRPMLDALVRHGGALLDADEKKRIQVALWQQGRLNRGMLARSPEVLCELSGLGRKELRESAFLMVEEQGVGPEYPFSGEKLSPLLAVYIAAD
ncbi:MAG: sulfoacetaldehyde dehydrogenase, partial [SAR324 cluster bacterium]|nr:sulfoacetaldehyde dehydrogenase [SAR324 cluster bacterium]